MKTIIIAAAIITSFAAPAMAIVKGGCTEPTLPTGGTNPLNEALFQHQIWECELSPDPFGPFCRPRPSV